MTALHLVWLATTLGPISPSNGVRRMDCFPVETLPKALRPQAEALLLRMMDREALFTLVGMKPMSSGWLETSVELAKPQTDRLDEQRRILATFRCGNELGTFFQPFRRTYGGKRMWSAYLFHRPAFSKKVKAHAGFFRALGLTPSSPPSQVIRAIENAEKPPRSRGYGYLYGYPDHAVDFFVESEKRTLETSRFVKREFFSVPVYGNRKHRFVWAIPAEQPPRAEDLRLRREAAPVVAAYTKLRARYVGPGKPGIVALIRDWMDDGRGVCSPETALRKAKKRGALVSKLPEALAKR